jgi:general secretion pathway protein F
MASFTYKALAPLTPGRADSTEVSGTITADTPGQARQLLREQGLAIYELVASHRSRGIRLFRWSSANRHRAKTVEFIRELSTLLAVGTPMVTALDTIIKQHASEAGSQPWRRWFASGVTFGVASGVSFRGVLVDLREQVAAGSTLSDAMRREHEVFDALSVNMVEMGEQSGTLDVVLDRLAEFKERSQQFRGKVGGALIYPCIVLVMAVLITLLLMTFVVPNILKPLTQAGRPLPFVTMVVKTLSDGLIGWWWLLLTGTLVFFIGVAAVLRTRRGRLTWHRWQLSMPLVGSLVRKQAVVRMALIISTMMRSGLVFLKALEVARRSTNNLVIQQALDDCKGAVHGGRDIAEALDDSGVFPPTVVQVFALGQQSGRLEDMLDRLAAGYDKQVTAATQRLTAVLEPVMILLLALLVGLIAFATVLPILEAGHVL